MSHHGHSIGALAGVEQPEGFCFLIKGSPGEEYCGFTPARGTRGSWVWTKIELHIFLSHQWWTEQCQKQRVVSRVFL